MITAIDRAVIDASRVAYEKYAACEAKMTREDASKIFLETYQKELSKHANILASTELYKIG